MVANNGGKVSNLTVGPTPSMGCPPFIQEQRRTVGVPTPNYTEPLFTGLAAAVGDTLPCYAELQNTIHVYQRYT